MTIREACDQAAKELGWPEEMRADARHMSALYRPGEGTKLIPAHMTERQAINDIKKTFQKFDAMTETERMLYAASILERLKKKTVSN